MTRDDIRAYVLDRLAGRLTCKEFVELVTDYLEGTLPLWSLVRFQLHLGLCQGCRVYLRQTKHTIQTLNRLPTDPPSSSVQKELLRRFRTWRQDRQG